MGFYDGFRDRESQARGGVVVSLAGFVYAIEAIKDEWLVCGIDSNATIAYGEEDMPLVCNGGEDDFALFGVLEGVGDEVVEDLGHAVSIDVDRGELCIGIDAEGESLVFGADDVGESGAF